LAFPTKLHRPLLEHDDTRLLVETRFRGVAKGLGVTILHLEINASDVRMRVAIPPDLAPVALVTKLKNASTHTIHARFPELKSRVATLWPWSTFIRSTGSSLPGAVEDYLLRDRGIHAQG
jgi:REP element-mobilizing transposase RayT